MKRFLRPVGGRACHGRGEERPVLGPAVPAARVKATETNMNAKMKVALAAVLVAAAVAPAFAPS
jgi:hypothetical protein